MSESMENKDVILKVEHLSQFFGKGSFVKKAVNDVSFDIKRGEAFGLVGESGCGKTTTGRTIIKLYDATAGNVWFNGTRIVAGVGQYEDAIRAEKAKLKNADAAQKAEINAKIAALKQEIKSAKYDHKHCDKQYRSDNMNRVKASFKAKKAEGKTSYKDYLDFVRDFRIAKRSKMVTKIQMIYQDPVASLDPRMTVREIISEGLAIQGIRDKEYINQKVYEMLDIVGLVHEHAERYPHEFSGGQRQRIGVARSVVMNPELIIADEPISALDVSIRAQVINLLNDLRSTMGLTIMFIAHDLSVVKYFCDRIGVMYFGNMVELASSDELFLNPLHPYTRSLLSAIPQPDPTYEKDRKRVVYDPLIDHDYSVDKPTFREVKPGHFVMCNQAEYEHYLEILK